MTNKWLPLLLGILTLAGCARNTVGYKTSGERPTLLDADTYVLHGVSKDPYYGWTSQAPIHVGGYEENAPAEHVIRYLNALRGPAGEAISYRFAGTCCEYPTTRDPMGVAELEVYILEYEGQELEPLAIYLDVYHYDRLKAPEGLSHAIAR